MTRYVIQLEAHPEGVVLRVKAHPGARRDEIRGEHDGALKIAVTQAPEKGKANQAILQLLAKHLQLRKSQVELLSGETNSKKRILVRGLTAAEVQSRL